jgi:hypothetical protein
MTITAAINLILAPELDCGFPGNLCLGQAAIGRPQFDDSAVIEVFADD